MYMQTNIHIHTHMHICTRVYALKYTYVSTQTHTHIRKHTYIRTYTYLFTHTICVEFFPFGPISLLAKDPSNHSAWGTDTGLPVFLGQRVERSWKSHHLRCNL